MAFIICQSCGRKISDKAPKCSFCGNDQGEQEFKTLHSSSIKSRKLINPAIVVSVVLALVISFAVFTVFRSFQVKKANREFAEMVGSVSTDLVGLAIESESLITEIKETWRRAIFEKPTDFNIALAELMETRQRKITDIRQTTENIAGRLKGMTPPSGKERDFQRLKELYLLFYKYAEMAHSPSGNFQTYSQKTQELNIEIKSAIREMDMVN
jgi:hypothetical protein